jgi:hypothetical protein
MSSYLSLPGTSGSYASAPDAAPISITGDIDLRCKVSFDVWPPTTEQSLVAMWGPNEGEFAYLLSAPSGADAGKLVGAFYDGNSILVSLSSTTAPVTAGTPIWLRVTRESATGTVTFYTSADGSAWTQLGTTASTSAGSLSDSTGIFTFGGHSAGTASNMAGEAYRAEVRDGIGGTLVLDAHFDEQSDGATSFADGLGNTITINGSAVIVATPAGPAAPSSLAVASVTSSSVNLTWDDAASVASGATGFTLEYDTVSTFDLGPTDIDIHIDDTETDTVMALAASTTYYFRVRAYNGSGNSAWSNTASGTTAAPPETTPPVVDSASVDSFGTTLTVELFEANSPPVLPASGVTGFTLTASGGAVTLSSAAISGTEYTATLSRAVTMNESLSLAYAPGNVTDSASPPNAMASFSGFPVANFSSIPDVAGSGKRASVGSPGVSSGGTRVGKSRIKIGG